MKVLVVSHGFPPRGRWGTEFYTHQLVHGLLRRGHTVRVLHPVRDGVDPRYSLREVEEDGVPVSLLANPGDGTRRFEPSYRDAEVERAFASLLERERFDVVHFTYLLWGLSVRLPVVARGLGVPSLVTLTDHGLVCHRGQMYDARLRACGGPRPAATCARCIRSVGPYDQPPLLRLLKGAAAGGLALLGGAGRVPVTADLEARERAVREAFEGASAFVAPTEPIARAALAAGLDERKLTRLVYAFDEEPYRAVRGRPAPDPARFGFLAQFGPHKGLHTLIEAARRLDRRDPARPWEVVLHGAGAGGRHRLYADQVLARRDPRRVKLGAPFGPAEAPEVVAGFSALVLPSEWDENAPLSVLQARAVGVPVLGSDVAGIAEALTPEAARRLVPVGDAEALAERMQAVLEGRIGRDPRPGLPLSLPAHLDQIEVLYGRIIEPLG